MNTLFPLLLLFISPIQPVEAEICREIAIEADIAVEQGYINEQEASSLILRCEELT